jgi:regulator of replication initiation timing
MSDRIIDSLIETIDQRDSLIEALKSDLTMYESKGQELETENKQLKERLEIAVKALLKYADKEKWSEPIEYMSDFGTDYSDEKTNLFMTPEWDDKLGRQKYCDGGYEYAQEALKQITPEMKGKK